MCEFVFFLGNEVDVKAPFRALFYIWRRYLFSFYYFKIHCKKMLLCIKRSFVWLKKIAFDESFYEIVLLLIQFFLARGCFCSCGREGCAMSYLIWGCFFIHLMIFFQWFDEIQSRFFLWDFLCLVSLRRGRFFPCWFVKKVFVEWIGSFVAWVVGEFLFVVDSVFFLHVVASVLVGRKVVQCLIWFEVVF